MTAVEAEAGIRFAESASADPAAAVARWKAVAGGKAVGCFPIYAPREIVAAAGMLPVTVWGDERPAARSRPFPSNLCPVARGMLSGILGGSWNGSLDAIVLSSTCGTIRDAAAILKDAGAGHPVFPIVFQAGSAVPGARECLLDRFEAIAEWAQEVAGRTVRHGAIEKAIRQENERNRLFGLLERRMAETPGLYAAEEYGTLARAGMVLPASVHGEVMRAALGRRGTRRPAARRRVFLSGMMAPRPVLAGIDAGGAALVGNDLALGHRHYAGEADESGDALLSLASRLLLREPCAALHCAGGSGTDALFARVRECDARSIILLGTPECEAEGGEVADIAAEARRRGIPFLCLEVDPAQGADPNLRDRVVEFLKQLRDRGGRAR